MKLLRRPALLTAVVAALVAVLAVSMLERQRAGLEIAQVTLASSPATIWRDAAAGPGPLAVIAHGYAGSRQMMQTIAITLARSGLVVVTFDFHGHGRHGTPMAGDVTSLDGATAQLARQTVEVAEAARELPGATGPVALVGHSMATDIVIRAAAEIDGIDAVVAISMYSDAVTEAFPERLLILSGAREYRLREVALERLRLVDPTAGEGETVQSDGVARRAAVAPWVGHVGVLYSPAALSEIRNWTAPPPISGGPAPATAGHWLLALLAALVGLGLASASLLGPPRRFDGAPARRVLFAVAAPVGPALIATLLMPPGSLGLSAFGQLAAFLGIWGAVQLAALRPSAPTIGTFGTAGFLLLLVWGLGVFAPALDRYGAAFVPVGPRWQVMVLMLAGTVPFATVDALLLQGAGWPLRLLARVVPLATLLVAMLVTPRLGVAFTVIPVMVLFWLVYGVVGRRIAARIGPMAPGLALGIILAWAIAASTPLVATV